MDFFDERIAGAAETVTAFAHQREMRTVCGDAGQSHRAAVLGSPIAERVIGANWRIVLLP